MNKIAVFDQMHSGQDITGRFRINKNKTIIILFIFYELKYDLKY